MPQEFYTNILYPLQDKVFKIFKGSPFYLTGGTVLSRGYYNYRYSDDLDYFVNYHPDFSRLVQVQIDELFKIFKDDAEEDYRGEYFCRVFVGKARLKIEMVNDLPARAGALVNHPILGMIDSKENILANKISAAVDRRMPKDIVDLYFLLRDGLDIKKALLGAQGKAVGIAPLYLAKILAEFDFSLLDTEIKWIKPISGEVVGEFFKNFSLAIVEGRV